MTSATRPSNYPITTFTPTVGSVVVIDTSFWISWFLNTDPNHASALIWLDNHLQNGGSLFAPMMLVIETASGIARATNRPTLAQGAANRLYTNPFITLMPINQELVDETVTVAAQFKLRGADAIFVALAKMEGVPLVSFDNEQLTRPISVIKTIRP